YPGEDLPGSRVRPAPLVKALIDIETGDPAAKHKPEPVAYFGPGRRAVGTPGPRVGGASRPTVRGNRPLGVMAHPASPLSQLTRPAIVNRSPHLSHAAMAPVYHGAYDKQPLTCGFTRAGKANPLRSSLPNRGYQTGPQPLLAVPRPNRRPQPLWNFGLLSPAA